MRQLFPRRRARRVLVGIACLISVLVALPVFADRLSSTRSGARSRAAPSASPGVGHVHAYPYGHSYYAYAYDPFWAWWGLRAVGAPWWVPYAAAGDHYDRPYAFPGAPYQGGIDGYVRILGVTPLMPDPNASQHPNQRLLGNSTAVRIAAEGSWIDMDMQRMGLSLLLSTNGRVEIGTDWSLFTENVHAGDPDFPSGGTDHLWLGTVDGSFLFAQGPHSQFRTGLGVRVRSGSVSANEYGINFLYGMDFYPVRPLIVSIRGDIGSVGDGFIARARGSFGGIVGHLELFAGFDNTWYRDQAWGGPVIGVRIWQ